MFRDTFAGTSRRGLLRGKHRGRFVGFALAVDAILWGFVSPFFFRIFPGFCLVWLLSFLACWPLSSWSLDFLAFGLWLFGFLAFWLLGFSACGFLALLFVAFVALAFPHSQHHQSHPHQFLAFWIFGWRLPVDGRGSPPPNPPLLCREQTPMNPTPTLNSRVGPKPP